MLEVVRACLTSDELVNTAEFFSFGTNDLTQAVFSFSREDAEGKFLPEYMEKELLETSPFQSIDVNGVGHLMKRSELNKEENIKKGLGDWNMWRTWRRSKFYQILPFCRHFLCKRITT